MFELAFQKEASLVLRVLYSAKRFLHSPIVLWFLLKPTNDLNHKRILKKQMCCVYELVTCWCHRRMIDYVSSPGMLDKYSPVKMHTVNHLNFKHTCTTYKFNSNHNFVTSIHVTLVCCHHVLLLLLRWWWVVSVGHEIINTFKWQFQCNELNCNGFGQYGQWC